MSRTDWIICEIIYTVTFTFLAAAAMYIAWGAL